MKSVLYNSSKNTVISRPFDGGYKIDGLKPELPNDVVELEIVHEDRPDYDPETQFLERAEAADIKGGKYFYKWDVIQKPAEQVEREQLQKQKAEERKQIIEALRSTPVPSSMPELQHRIEKLERLILELL